MQKSKVKTTIFCPRHGGALSEILHWEDLRNANGIQCSELDPSITHYAIWQGTACSCRWVVYGTQQDGDVKIRMLDAPEIPESIIAQLDQCAAVMENKAECRPRATVIALRPSRDTPQ